MLEEAIPLKDAAEKFGIKPERLRRAAWDGRLQARRDGPHWMVRPMEVERFIRENGRAPQVEALPRREDMPDARVIAVAVPKGGTGKTTTSLNLGAALHEAGQRVLLIDFDPQGSLTLAMLGRQAAKLEYTVQDAIKSYITTYEPEVERAIVPTPAGIDLVPATTRLNLSNSELINAAQPRVVLRALVEPLRSRYDFILIDTLPYLGILVENALVAADEVLVPVPAEFLDSESAALMVEHVRYMRKSGLNPTLKICGFLLTKVRQSRSIQRQYVAYARRKFGVESRVFTTMVDEGACVPESLALSQTVFQYRPMGPAATAYREVAKEVLDASY
ncbi:MAG TPA: AAA family ATPase [Herpetosiphonaceae bacterium]|nr:AAA family ATPase [Herpetosiphonaceae bacterium]